MKKKGPAITFTWREGPPLRLKDYGAIKKIARLLRKDLGYRIEKIEIEPPNEK